MQYNVYMIFGLIPLANLLIVPPAVYLIMKYINKRYKILDSSNFLKSYVMAVYILLLISAVGVFVASTAFI
jgi:hypothetical protein